jgi:putative transposase
MSSYRQILYHIIFGTKNRLPSIPNDVSENLYKYIWGVIKNHNCVLYRINGIEDHIHMLCDLHPSCNLSELVKDIKVSSSFWIKNSNKYPLFTGWSEGYAAITLSSREKESVMEYIKNQREHHKKIGYFDEYKKFLDENKIEFEEKYLFK